MIPVRSQWGRYNLPRLIYWWYINLVGGFNMFQPSWKIWKSMGRMTSHILWKIKHVWNRQPVMVKIVKTMVFINKYGVYMVNITQTWLIYRGNAPLVCETNVMWVKQCHKPSPSRQYFYSWDNLTIPSHGWFIMCITQIRCVLWILYGK